MAEYRIEYSIQRRLDSDDEDNFTEVGFGSSGGWGSIDQAGHITLSAIQSREWETEGDMPSPNEVDGGDDDA